MIQPKPSSSIASQMIFKMDHIHRTAMTSFGEVVYSPGGSYGPRVQDRYELIFLQSGSLSIQIDGVEVLLSPGEVALLKPGHTERLKFSGSKRSHQAWCILRKEIIPSSLISRLSVTPLSIKVSREMQLLLDLALGYPLPVSSASGTFLDHLALTILSAYLKDSEQSVDTGRTMPPAVLRAINYIEHHLSEPISLVEISAAACVTTHHLIKLFRKYLDVTPSKYLWLVRLQRGGELLRTTVLGVSEIAYQVGYQSPFHFSRCFKASSGLSPKEFRAKLWNLPLKPPE